MQSHSPAIASFDDAFSTRDGHQGAERAKPGTALIQMSGIECKPTIAGSHNVAQMRLEINEATD